MRLEFLFFNWVLQDFSSQSRASSAAFIDNINTLILKHNLILVIKLFLSKGLSENQIQKVARHRCEGLLLAKSEPFLAKGPALIFKRPPFLRSPELSGDYRPISNTSGLRFISGVETCS